jgi:hypothetical protein
VLGIERRVEAQIPRGCHLFPSHIFDEHGLCLLNFLRVDIIEF